MIRLILASQSTSRRGMLTAAAVPFEARSAQVDEESAKAALRADGADARVLADALAELKALKVSTREPEALVLGCDQTLELDDGSMIDKAENKAHAAQLLTRMSGCAHHLHSAAVIAQAGAPIWRSIESVTLAMRDLSPGFIADYLDAKWDAVSGCVGCYRIEGRGAQLFRRIDGSQFAIQGLPMLALLDFLRVRGVLAT